MKTLAHTATTTRARWLRQGSAALLAGVVVVFGGVHACAEFSFRIVPSHFEEQTKVSVLFSPENIPIMCGAVAIDSFSTVGVHYLSYFNCRKYYVGFGIKQDFATGTNRENAFVRLSRQSSVKLLTYRMVNEAGDGLDMNLFCRCLSGVNQFEVVKVFPALVVLDRKISTSDGQISPQLVARRADHDDENGSLQKSASSDSGAKKYRYPVIERLIVCILFIFGGFFLALNAPDDNRVLLGAACVGGGLLLVASGLGLWWLTLFPATWGWLL
jgi:hypothetical protein